MGMDDLRAEAIDLLCTLPDDEVRRVLAFVREIRDQPAREMGLESLLEESA